MKGVLHFHSETGTEGGHWAFQDGNFIGLDPGDRMYHCKRCGRIWDKERFTEEPKPSFTYWDERDVKYTSGDREWTEKQWHAHSYDEWHDDLPLGPPYQGPDGFDAKWNARSNQKAQVCVDLGHQWQSPREEYPDGVWSYEGLHILKDGDKLTIFDKDEPDRVIWQGEIQLNRHGLFTETAFGMWIHADQQGQDREAWARLFIEGYPAELER